MNKEQLELLDEAYKNYASKTSLHAGISGHLTREEFINKIKTGDEFAKRWAIEIGERELSLEERYELALPIWKENYGPFLAGMMVPTNVDNTPFTRGKIPRKAITVTYKDKTIESYLIK